jgi:hypothetical protein
MKSAFKHLYIQVPVAGLALILGLDRFMSEARAITNIIGNGIATIVISRCESEIANSTLRAAPLRRTLPSRCRLSACRCKIGIEKEMLPISMRRAQKIQSRKLPDIIDLLHCLLCNCVPTGDIGKNGASSFGPHRSKINEPPGRSFFSRRSFGSLIFQCNWDL